MTQRPCERRTPDEVRIRRDPREPETDPTLGVPVPEADDQSKPAHRLVTIGDSLTQGFMSGAVHRTDLSWPAIVANELCLQGDQFRFPTYEWPTGPGGLPLDLERLIRAFEGRFGHRLDFWEIISAARWVQSYMDDVEDYWERDQGSAVPPAGPSFHNMAVYGWDVLDARMLTSSIVRRRIDTPSDDAFDQIVENAGDRASWVVLQRARSGTRPRTVLDAARAMSRASGGVETLVVMLGANNALGSVVSLKPCWTSDDYLDLSPAERLRAKGAFNVWRPAHFDADWELLVEELRRITARHVIVATIPAVTIAPIARGVHGKVRPQSRYFPYYTRPWITDADFDPKRDPHITEVEARAIDSAIHAYNKTIIETVRAARRDGRDWYLFDLGGMLDRLASRRYLESPWTRPSWWTPYQLPVELRALDPIPNTRFFRSGSGGRTDGGLFSLDGVHPTTSSYGLVAQEVIRIMQRAGVAFPGPDGQPRADVDIDFGRLLPADTLLSAPPTAVSPTLGLLGWLDDQLDWVRRILPFMPSPL